MIRLMQKWYCLIMEMIPLFPAGVVAVPAYPGLVKLLQPGGEEITVYMRGDEKVHWMESPDGYSLMYDGDKRIVFAATGETGNMVPSAIIYRDALLRSSIIDGQLAGIPKNLRYSASQVEVLKNIWNMTKSSMEQVDPIVPATGTIHAICPLVGFPDKPFGKTKAEFEALMNQAGYNTGGATGSVRDFYYENSYGQMELVVTVAGPYTASHELKYYGENVNGNCVNVSHMIELTGEIAGLAFAGVSPADYDNNNDGYIDAFHFIYAGYGEEAGGDADAIWAHAYTSLSNPFNVGDNKRLSKYSCSPELRGRQGSGITRIGVIAHEMGHIFGLPDFYDADAGTDGSYTGTGKWDLMAAGSWNGVNNDGSSPAHINMYAKIQLGWVNPVILDSPREITGMPNSAGNPVAYVYNTPVEGEYYVLENRQKEGFDGYVPGSGLLIYHVSLTGDDIRHNRVNNTHPQRMYPVCASSTYQIPSGLESYGSINSAGCPFPGTSGKTSFTDTAAPAAFTWEGTSVGRPVTEIKEQNGLISFKFMQDISTGAIKPNPFEIQNCPNPIKQGGILTIDLGNDFAGAQLSFYSVSGRLLLQTDVSGPVYRRKIDFAPGIYALQIRKKSHIINRKMIVN